MKRIYIAGAYDDHCVTDVLANMRRGIQLGIDALHAGFAPFIPWLDFQLFLMSDKHISREAILAYSTRWLEASDAVLVVPEGVDESMGTQAELARANELGIPVFWDLDAMCTYWAMPWDE
jgi:hypothetical protein